MTTGIAEIAHENLAQRWLRVTQFSVDHAAEAIFWINREGHLVYVNEQAVRSLGYTRDELLSMTVADLDPLEPLERWPSVWEQLRRDGGLTVESIHRRKDGSEFPIWVTAIYYADDQTQVSFACCRDISEKKAAEQALRRANEELEQRVALRTAELAASEARYQDLYHNAPDMFASIDADSGQIVQCNRTLVRATCYSADELLTKQFADLFHPDSQADALLVWSAFLSTGEVRGQELVLRCQDGSRIDISLNMSAVRDANGRIVHARSILHDITAFKRAQLQIERHRSELAHVARLATTGEMAAGLAHELNQPLYALNNFAQGALRRLEDDNLDRESLTAVLKDVARESKRAADTIRSLRRYVRKREQIRDHASANEIVRRVIRLLSSETKRRDISLHASLEQGLPRVFCDVIQIEQVLLNLILNGMDAMADQVFDEKRIEVRTSAATPASVEFAVVDRGKGLAPGDEHKIFDAFYTTKEEGLGLGLAISRTIIELHGGQLIAVPNRDRGITVSFKLSTSHSPEVQ